MKTELEYSLIRTRDYLLTSIWRATRNAVKYPAMNSQYGLLGHEMTCALITLDASLGNARESQVIFRASSHGLRTFLRHEKARAK